MGEELIKSISHYLSIETNYAVIVNGHYGIGKTFFVKHSLFPAVQKISIFSNKDKDKKYFPIHISLFGINSLEEIQTQVFFEMLGFSQRKGLKLASAIGKPLFRGAAQLMQLGDINDYIKDITAHTKELINYDEIVLVFDDFDRLNNINLVKQIFGFINNLVENHGAKVIIIANEDILVDHEDYTTAKEKVIGVTIQFKTDVEAVYNNIIKSRYATAYKEYYTFLTDTANEKIIADSVKINGNNFRSLIFFLEHFRHVFYDILDLFENDVDFKVLKEEKLKAVLEFTLAIAFEYKNGDLTPDSYEEIQNLDKIHLAELARRFSDEPLPNQIKDRYSDRFRNKYYSRKSFYNFESIFLRITNQSHYTKDKLKREIGDLFAVKDGIISETQEILTQLDYNNCLYLDNKTYRARTKEMLNMVDQGKFNLVDYPTVFLYTVRYNNFLIFDLDKLVSRFKKGIKNGETTFSLESRLNYKINPSDTEYQDHLFDLMRYCDSTKESLEKKQAHENYKDLQKLFNTDFSKFLDEVRRPDKMYQNSPYLSTFSISKLYSTLLKMSNVEIRDLGFYFQERYHGTFDILVSEKELLTKLKDKINAPKTRQTKNLRNEVLNILVDQISKAIKKIP